MEQIFDLIIQGLKACFDNIDKVQFMGITLLDLLITLILIAVALPIVLTLLQGSRFSAESYHNSQVAKSNARSEYERRRAQSVKDEDARFLRNKAREKAYKKGWRG